MLNIGPKHEYINNVGITIACMSVNNMKRS